MATKKKPLSDKVEVSVPLVPDKTWSYKWNDERVTYDQHKQLTEDHRRWVIDQEKAAAADTPPRKRKTK